MLPDCKLMSVLTGFRAMHQRNLLWIKVQACTTVFFAWYLFCDLRCGVDVNQLFFLNFSYLTSLIQRSVNPVSCQIIMKSLFYAALPSLSYGNVTKIFLSMQDVQSCKYKKTMFYIAVNFSYLDRFRNSWAIILTLHCLRKGFKK